MTFSVADAQVQRKSHLDADGWLVDVDQLIANGYHSATDCANCGEMLTEVEPKSQRFRGCLYCANGGQVELHYLANVNVFAINRAAAEKLALDMYWDSRLDSASQHPVFVWSETIGGYNDQLDFDKQISMEEAIASLIFVRLRGDDALDRINEEDCQDVARQILIDVLRVFRPDLSEVYNGRTFGSLATFVLDELTPDQRAQRVMYQEPYDDHQVRQLTEIHVADTDIPDPSGGGEDDIRVAKGDPYLSEGSTWFTKTKF